MKIFHWIYASAVFVFVPVGSMTGLFAQASLLTVQSRPSAYENVALHMGSQMDPSEPVKCGLGVVTFAFNNRAALSAPLRSDATLLMSRPRLQKNVIAGNFRIHYDTTGMDEPALLNDSRQRIPGSANAFADSVGAILRYVLPAEVNTLGYPYPPLDGTEGGGPEYDIYVLELGSLYGYTTPETPLNNKPDGGTYTTFMTIDNDFAFVHPDSNKGLPALRVTLAHELHHAIQIGNYGYWTNDIYYYEMTSTWMEDVVYPTVNDYLQYLKPAQAHFKNPEIPFTEANQIVEYSRAIWCHYASKKFGRDAVRRSWEEIRSVRPPQAIDNALQSGPYASSFRKAFAEWTLWNYYTGSRSDSAKYYPEGSRYPLMSETVVEFSAPGRDIPGSLKALSARYYQVMAARDTLTLALSNVDLTNALTGSGTLFPYTYRLNVSKVDDSYLPTAANIFVKLDVSEQTNWYSWDIVRGATGPATIVAGAPFPNPFVADGRTSLYIPVTSAAPVRGSLLILSSSMDLVYSSSMSSALQLGKQVFTWKGNTNDDKPVETGVYFYVIDLEGQSLLKGKLVVVRK